MKGRSHHTACLSHLWPVKNLYFQILYALDICANIDPIVNDKEKTMVETPQEEPKSVPGEQVQDLVDKYNALVGEKNNLIAILNEMKTQAGNHAVEVASRDAEINRLNGILQQALGGNQEPVAEEE